MKLTITVKTKTRIEESAAINITGEIAKQLRAYADDIEAEIKAGFATDTKRLRDGNGNTRFILDTWTRKINATIGGR